MEMTLHALRLSQSAHLSLTSYKRTLYREYDAVSSIAFPPLVPLRWSHGTSPTELPYITPLPQPLTTASEPVCIENSWYLRIKESEYISGILQDFRTDERGLFPVHEGIYLGSAEEMSSLIPIGDEIRISDLWLTTMRISYTDQDRWWEDLFISILREQHIR